MRLRFPAGAVKAALLLLAAALAWALAVAQAGAAELPPPPALDAKAAILVDAESGRWLFDRAAEWELPVASTTKLMTALVTLEHTRLDQMLTEPEYYPAAVDSQIGLRPGERMSVHDLFEALMLPSADDAAEDLAYNVGRGSIARFLEMMNARAVSLGLRHTHYTTPIGLDTPGNYSTAGDLASLARYDLFHSAFFARVVALPSAVLRTGRYVRVIENRNDLVSRYAWINGVKTGHTYGAGYVLVASARRGGLHLISVVLGTPSEYERDATTLALLDYGFSNFHLVSPVHRGQVVRRVPVRDQPGRWAILVAARSFTSVLPRRARITLEVQVPGELSGPRRRGSQIGRLLVRNGSTVLDTIPLALARDLPAVSGWTKFTRWVQRPSRLVPLLALVAGLCALLLLLIGRRSRARGARGAEPKPA